MAPRYLHLRPEQPPPALPAEPRRAVIVADLTVSDTWLRRIADWIVATGFLYVVAWGKDCEKWHDGVDWAILEAFDFNDIPDEHFIMTTWHNDQPLSEAFWFAGHCASHPDVELGETIILHIAAEPQGSEILQAYRDSQVATDET